MQKNEIILYQPDDTISLEVRVEDETVWLTQAQMAKLFQKDRTVITRHINNIFQEGELDEESNVHYLHFANSDRPIGLYNLDVIISVGYRVKSQIGTRFRRWANSVLKKYILQGYAINQRIEQLENKVEEHDKQIAFFVRTALPPPQGIFFDGQIFDAYAFVSELIRSAKSSITLIDNYVDESVLLLLSKRSEGVSARVITRKVSESLQLDIDKFNRQYAPIEVLGTPRFHDRFLIIDDSVYHIGASLKDLGKKLFAFSKLDVPVEWLEP
ncbi:MAG: virulence RhuM family protein [Bacteroidales bacterium]|nr:virulence RhuM family protein [Bacteroidales bacterium]